MDTYLEYQRALARIDNLMRNDPDAESDEGRALVALVDCVLDYELRHFPILHVEMETPHETDPH